MLQAKAFGKWQYNVQIEDVTFVFLFSHEEMDVGCQWAEFLKAGS